METEWRTARAKLRELLRENPRASHGELAKQIGYSISWVRKWRERLAKAAPDDEQVINCLSHRPKTIRYIVTEQIEKRIINLRLSLTELYERKVGARTIAAYLRKEASDWEGRVPTSSATIWRVLRRQGCIITTPRPEKHPFERPDPGLWWEMDWCTAANKSAEAPDKQQNALEVFNVVDRGSSYCLDSEASTQYDAERALLAIAAALSKWGVPQVITYDRDPRLVGSQGTDGYPSAFTRFLLCIGCTPDILPPRRPDLKPFVERFQRTLKEECLSSKRPTTTGEANTELKPYCERYNKERPHQGRGNHDLPPLHRFMQRPMLRPLPETVDPDAWLEHYHHYSFRRHVDRGGTIQLWKHTYYVGTTYANQGVRVVLDAKQRLIHVEIGRTLIKSIPLRGLVGQTLDYHDFLGLMCDEARSEWKTYLWNQRVKAFAKAG